MLDRELMRIVEEYNIGATPYYINKGYGNTVNYWIYAEKGRYKVEIQRKSAVAIGKRYEYTVWYYELNGQVGYEKYYDDELQNALRSMRKWLLKEKQEQMTLL